MHVLHSWGGMVKSEMYHVAANAAGIHPLSYGEAKDKFGRDNAFKGACDELAKILTNKKLLFDAVLIDEAVAFAVYAGQIFVVIDRKSVV